MFRASGACVGVFGVVFGVLLRVFSRWCCVGGENGGDFRISWGVFLCVGDFRCFCVCAGHSVLIRDFPSVDLWFCGVFCWWCERG